MQSDPAIDQQLTTLRDYLRWAVSQFSAAGVYYGHGTDNALDEALRLLLPTLGIPEGSERELLDGTLTFTERRQVIAVIEKRTKDRIPVPYITGEAWFAGMPYKVNPSVLIPRSPIAELIDAGFEPWLQLPMVTNILDLCTGSGCIGIACSHYFEEAMIDLADISTDALGVAQENIERYELQHRVNAIDSDLFSGLQGKQYDLIVSNPPYVDREDLLSMPAEYQHEPALALGSGDDGLDLTRKILQQAADYLTEEGVLVVEVGNSGIALEQAFPSVPFTWVEFERGGHGVFVFNRSELISHREKFNQGL